VSRRPRSQPKPTKAGQALKLYPLEVFKPLDRDMPGQGRLDFSQDGPVVVYDDEEDQP
jgi:hypothetical protein